MLVGSHIQQHSQKACSTRQLLQQQTEETQEKCCCRALNPVVRLFSTSIAVLPPLFYIPSTSYIYIYIYCTPTFICSLMCINTYIDPYCEIILISTERCVYIWWFIILAWFSYDILYTYLLIFIFTLNSFCPCTENY